jgi:uncharacterized Zn finger protein (UPF0148 family)
MPEYHCPVCGCAEELCPYPTFTGENWWYCPTCDDYRLNSEFEEYERQRLNQDYKDDFNTRETIYWGL